MPTAEAHAPFIPAAVKAAAANAARLQNDLINPPKEKGEEGEPPAEGETPESLAAGVEEQQPPAEPPVAPAEPPDNDDSWKHKFLSMQGRYNSVAAQVKNMSAEITNLNKLLATVQQPAPLKPATPAGQSLIKPEEIAEYGPELIDLISRAAREATAPYQEEIASLKGQLERVGGQIQTNARDVLMASLEAEVPEWDEVNKSDEFIAWLALPDAYSGAIRHDMLRAAFARNDSRRVIAFFKGFLAETAATAPAEQEPGKPAVPSNKPSLKSLAAPGRAKSTAAPTPAPAEKPIFTTSQITAFYTDKANGKFRGREKDAAKIEADIFAAQMEGRIR